MRLPRLAVENRSFTWMLFIFLLFIGMRALFLMPRTENPSVTIPGASIVAVMPGASPVDLEKLIALPVEDAINELEDIKRISTSVRDGFVIVSVEFDFDTDADEKYNEVVQQFNSIRNELPDEIMQLEIWKWSTSDVAMLQLALISDSASFSEIRVRAELLQNEIEKVKSVKEVNLLALPEEEVHIELDFEKMARVHTTIDMITRAIQSNNANIPAGDIEIGNRSLNVKSSGAYENLEEIRKTVVNSYQGRLIYLENIARVTYGFETLKYYARFGGDFSTGTRDPSRRSIFMTVSQKEGYNVLTTADEVFPVILHFRENLPQDMGLEVVFDQPRKVRDRINNFLMNLLQGIILVGLVIFVSLGIRSSLVVVLAIPLSIVIGLGFLDLFGYALQQISIAGLIVALGLLVDNSIVMVENIDRYRNLGYDRKEASYKAASEIGWPVVTATLTTVFAFIPIAAMPDKTGAFIESLPVTIMITLAVSLLIALTLTPTITASVYREKQQKANTERGIRKLLKWLIEHPFRTSLRYSLGKPWVVILISVVVLAGSGIVFRYVGISFFPKAEQPNLMLRATLPDGSNIKATDRVARYIEQVLDTLPEVKYYATNVGHGNPRIYYNTFPTRNDLKLAEIYVELYAFDPDDFNRFVARLRDTFREYTGARISVKEFEQGPPFEAPIQIFITGDDFEDLKRISGDVENMLEERPGVINLENQFVKTNTELLFDINKDKANMFGVPVVEVDRTIRTAISGMEISKFRYRAGKEYGIILQMDDPDDFQPEDLDRIYVSSMSGRQIPIRQLVDLKLQQGTSNISRYNLERTAEILAGVETGYNLDDIMEPVIGQLEAYPFPEGVSYTIGGELQSREESFGGMFNAVIIALISIMAILVLQFRSFRQPVLIFIAIPFAAIGMVWALIITGNTFSFTAFVGLTSLIGIVVNNSIILVDYTNKLRDSGKSLDEAIQLAAETRLTPIVLTAFTTIGGLLPLTLRGGTLWAPMGWTIIGGLLVSTLLTLIVVPVFYKLLEARNQG